MLNASGTSCLSVCEQLVVLGSEMNSNQYRVVHLAARYEEEREWFVRGLKSAAFGISVRLGIEVSTAREWIRVGRSLGCLPLIDAAFESNEISYAKARILTRWADSENEARLVELADHYSANRLTTAVARLLDQEDPCDEQRDRRLHEGRSLTTYTNGDGMTVIRIVLPPAIAKPVVAAVDQLVQRIAQTPPETEAAVPTATVTQDAPGDASGDASECGLLAETLAEMAGRWHPEPDDEWLFPTVAQQRADAFTALFLRLNVQLTTEVVLHVRGNGNTFDDGRVCTEFG